MITATRNWLKRNRTTLAISAGVVGGVYYAGQWALGKFTEARQRMSDERIAKEKYVNNIYHSIYLAEASRVLGSKVCADRMAYSASAADSRKTKKTARIPSWPSFPQQMTTSTKPFQ